MRLLSNGMQRDNAKGVGSGYTTLFREYDPEIARWRSPDPKLKDFPSESPFSAMGNNPIMNTDVLGDNYGYTIFNNTISIQVNNYVSSSNSMNPGFTNSFLNEMGERANEMLNNDGDGWKIDYEGQTYTVLINITYLKGRTENLGENNIATYTDENFVWGPTARDANYSPNLPKMGRNGLWISSHENGHFMGLKDRYSDYHTLDENTNRTTDVSKPKQGWQGNIMGEFNGEVEPRNIKSIIQLIEPSIQLQKQTGMIIQGIYNGENNNEYFIESEEKIKFGTPNH